MKKSIFLLFCMSLAVQGFSGGEVAVLGNSIDSENAAELYSILSTKDILVHKFNASTFDMFKNKSNIIILGGHNSPEGVVEITSTLLSDAEKKMLMNPYASKIFLKKDVYTPNQSIFLFSGYGAQDTRRAWADGWVEVYRSVTNSLLSSIKVIAPTSVEVKKMRNVFSQSIPVNLTNQGSYPIFGVPVDARISSNQNVSVSEKLVDMPPSSSQRILIKIDTKYLQGGENISFSAGDLRTTIFLNVSEERVGVCQLCLRG
ncbi:MAG: hypothetical protein KKD39_05735 [Candidatus Altiarchaeota archaeon]|nr:hypothetical protein [Candidatus Altiarchaeota archaeon]